MVIVCVCLYFFPAMHEKSVLAAETRQKLAERGLHVENAVVHEENPQKIVVDTPKEEGSQLQIELPEGTTEQELYVENDYLTQTVYIRFRNGIDDYFAEYGISGSSDHIASLFYYKEKDEGVIVIGLDTVYELKETFTEGSLHIDFFSPHEIYDKVIVVDAGHGSRAVGAVKREVMEKNINLDIVLQLKNLLDESSESIGVYYTRLNDTNPTLDQRVQLANKVDADLFISVHNNSSRGGNFSSVSGTQVMYSESDDSELSSKRLAEICLKNVVEEFGSNNKGLIRGDRIYIIRTSKVPVALVEVGFMSNKEELEKLISEEYQRKAAQGIYNAIFEAFEEGY